MNIKEVRTELGMKQKEFAKWLKVTAGCVSRWESGKRKVPDSTLQFVELKLILKKLSVWLKEIDL